MAWRTRAAAAAVGAAAIGVTGLVPALAAEQVSGISAGLTKVTVLNINDFHGRIGGDAGLSFACTVVKEKSAAGGNSVFLSAGDNIGATPFVSSSQQDTPTIEFLNALGLQTSAVGNHEFDRGFADLTGRVADRADYTHLGANVYQAGTTTPALDAYDIFEIGGVSVGVIGAVTQETPSLVLPSGVAGLTFGDPVAAVNRVAGQLSDGNPANGEADIIIAQYHEGATTGEPSTLAEQIAAGGAFADIVNNTSDDVDAIFTAHTHMAYAWDGPAADGTRPVVQTGSYGANLAKVELGVDTSTMTVVEYTRALLPASAPDPACEADPAFIRAAEIADAASTVADEIGSEVVGEITADITTAHSADGARDDRLRESTLGNLTANAWLWAMNQDGRPGADIGIMNPGGLRAELLYGTDGVITLKEVADVHPFANTMQVIDVTGAQVVTLLEQQWQPADASRPFLKLGLSDNVRYTFDPDAPQGSKITGVWVDGAPIDEKAVFTIASGQFLIEGGDNFTILRDGTNKRDSGLIDTDAFLDYFAENSPVTPSFEKNGVAVSGALPVEGSAGSRVSFTVSGVDLSSLGAPDNTSFDIFLGEGSASVKVGTAAIETLHLEGLPTRDGQSKVTFTIPKDYPRGDAVITLVAQPSGTVVKLEAVVAAGASGPVIETDVPADGGFDQFALLGGLIMASLTAVVLHRRRQVTQH